MRKSMFFVLCGVMVWSWLLSGCWQPEYADQEYIDAVPTTETLKIKLPEGGQGGLPAPMLMTMVAPYAEFYEMTHKTTYDVNEGIAHILMWVHEILKYPVSARDGDTYTWGPWRGDGLDPTEYKFTMGKGSEPDTFHLTFWGRHKSSESEADFKPWIDGNVLKGSQPHHGVGTLDIYFTDANELDPVLHPEIGRFAVTFDTINDPHDVELELIDFQSPGDTAPINGAYHYHEYADLSGDFRFFARGNVIDESMALEQLDIRTRWLPTGEGLAEASVTGGDLDAVGWSGFTITECWDENYFRSYYEDVIADSDLHLNPTEGEASACPVFEQDGEA